MTTGLQRVTGAIRAWFLRRTFAQIALVVGLIVVVSAQCFLWYQKNCSGPFADNIGKPIAAVFGTSLFDRQAQILLYGLKDASGLAVVNHDLYIAQSGRRIIVVNPEDEEKTKVFPRVWFACPPNGCLGKDLALCPHEACDAREIRGIQAWSNGKQSYVALAEQGRLRASIDGRPFVGSQRPTQADSETEMYLSHTSGLWQQGTALFATSDTALAEENDIRHSGSGALVNVQISNAGFHADALSFGLTHPSGVTAYSENGPVYVAEEYPDRVVWSIYQRTGQAWTRTGQLGEASTKQDHAPVPPFLGMAIWRNPNDADLTPDQPSAVIFAAGPGGLYAFRANGTALGRMQFDEPVTGIAIDLPDPPTGNTKKSIGEARLYVVMNHFLCRITLPPFPQKPVDIINPEPVKPPNPPPHPHHACCCKRFSSRKSVKLVSQAKD